MRYSPKNELLILGRGVEKKKGGKKKERRKSVKERHVVFVRIFGGRNQVRNTTVVERILHVLDGSDCSAVFPSTKDTSMHASLSIS